MERFWALVAEFGWQAVEVESWFWAATLGAERCAVVEAALVGEGVDGVADLVGAGPAHGGIDDDELADLIATLGTRFGALALAA